MITYEEMVKVKPQVKRPRPILLVGEFERLCTLHAIILGIEQTRLISILLLHFVAPRGKPFNLHSLTTRLVKENPKKFGKPIDRKVS